MTPSPAPDTHHLARTDCCAAGVKCANASATQFRVSRVRHLRMLSRPLDDKHALASEGKLSAI
eukprot:12755093-Heterocapsa_arctica.AAC.1